MVAKFVLREGTGIYIGVDSVGTIGIRCQLPEHRNLSPLYFRSGRNRAKICALPVETQRSERCNPHKMQLRPIFRLIHESFNRRIDKFLDFCQSLFRSVISMPIFSFDYFEVQHIACDISDLVSYSHVVIGTAEFHPDVQPIGAFLGFRFGAGDEVAEEGEESDAGEGEDVFAHAMVEGE